MLRPSMSKFVAVRRIRAGARPLSHHKLLLTVKDPAEKERLAREVPLGRLVGAREDALFAAYLCSAAADCFVGQVFPVCGGCPALTLPLSAGLGALGLQPGARRTAGLLGEGA